MDEDVVGWTAAQVKELLPGLEGESLFEAVRYSLSLPPDDTDRHWRSLLGSNPRVDSFIKQLRQRRQSPLQPTPQRPHQPPPYQPPIEVSRTPPASKVLRITNTRRKGPGKLTSDLGKSKPKPPQPSPLAQAIEENRPLTELEEIDSALQSITLTKKRVACGCFGTIHEVYPLAPNCLICGRIICVAEGIGKCFYCGEELVSEVQKEEVVRELRLERGFAKTKAANEKVRKVRTADGRHRIWASKVGGQLNESDSETSGHSTPDMAYLEAERKRDELLEFDRTFAERTRIIDQQAEFTPQSTLHDKFSTPQERAAALRRLQQLEAEQAAAERARSRRVLDIDFKTGKGNVRGARADDLMPMQPSSPIEKVEHRIPNRVAVEIVNGFAKPTFVE